MKLFVLATSALAISVSAKADLVQNGGFESGGFDGWNHSPTIPYEFYVVSDSYKRSGSYALAFADPTHIDSVYQDISTTAGTSYKIDFWLRTAGINSPGDPAGQALSTFQGLWDGTQLMSTSNTLFGYTEYTFYRTATSNSTRIEFEGFNAPNAYYLDDVSVKVVPLPVGSALGIGGLAGVGGFALIRRRRIGD